MISKLRLVVLAAGVAAAACVQAVAADYDPPIFVDQPSAEEYVPVEVGSGWYLRGDIGYAVSTKMDNVRYRTFDALSSTYSDASFSSSDLDTDFNGGIGFGYRFTDYLRADLTLDMFKGDFEGTTSADFACPGELVGTGCRTEDSTSFYSTNVMANGYVDLGTYASFTPYLGAGIGVSRVKWDELTNRSYCVPGVDVCSGLPLGASEHEGQASWRLNYALMAGMAYDVSNNLKLDLGYRFRHIDGGSMFGWDAGSEAAGASGTQGEDDGFSTHEVKVGLRYELW